MSRFEVAMDRSPKILDYQQHCFSDYAKSLRLPRPYTYPDGNPIRPLPPIQTHCGGLMIVGAYPSARFEARRATNGRYRLIPIADNLQPFGREEYFDGVRRRVLESGKGFEEHLLGPLKLTLKQCWVTDLVKVFLYKPEHIDNCRAVAPKFNPHETRSRFLEFAEQSLKWLRDEVLLCKPKLIVTLGQEVAQVVSGDRSAKSDDLLNRSVEKPDAVGGYPTLYLPHPDACRRFPKWRQAMAERVRLIRSELSPRTS